MRIARQHILTFQYRSVDRFALGVIDLYDTLRRFPQELRIMELMSTIFFSVEHKLPVAQREFTVCLARRNPIGQHTAHLVLAIIRNNALAEIHHPSTFSDDAPSPLSIFLDGSATALVANQCRQMFFRIAARQIEQIDTLERRDLRLGVEESYFLEAVDILLIKERKRFIIPSYNEP